MGNHQHAFRLCIVLTLTVVLPSLAATPYKKRTPKTKVTDITEKADDAPVGNPDDPTSPRYGAPQTIRFRVGAEITATNGACRGITTMVTVPLDCTEQKVTFVDEDFSPEVADVTFRPLPGGEVKQMVISVPRLNDGATARAVLTCEVATRSIQPPEKTDDLKIAKKIPAKIRMYVMPSPYIEINNTQIHAFNKEIADSLEDSANDWTKIEAIYDAVLKKIDYVEGPDKSAVEALHDKQADCQGRSALFIALCRLNKVPARMVWVHGHCYPEFYMEHAEGEGYWYPCESAGTRAFGEMPLARTILQKGDNFRVPERKEKLRYASDYTVGLPTPGGGKPHVKYVREIVPQSVAQ
jgi:predicted secreted protein